MILYSDFIWFKKRPIRTIRRTR